MANILKKIIENDKGEIRKLEKMADKVMSYEDEMAALTDEELQAKTVEFKERYANGETLDQLLFEAFAVVREGAKRVLGLFPYKVQIMGGIVLHHGDVPEMQMQHSLKKQKTDWFWLIFGQLGAVHVACRRLSWSS